MGGHSKGGNFAMYAAAFCDAEYKERIVKVYNNDGPGFREEVIQTPEFQGILPRILTTTPPKFHYRAVTFQSGKAACDSQYRERHFTA